MISPRTSASLTTALAVRGFMTLGTTYRQSNSSADSLRHVYRCCRATDLIELQFAQVRGRRSAAVDPYLMIPAGHRRGPSHRNTVAHCTTALSPRPDGLPPDHCLSHLFDALGFPVTRSGDPAHPVARPVSPCSSCTSLPETVLHSFGRVGHMRWRQSPIGRVVLTRPGRSHE